MFHAINVHALNHSRFRRIFDRQNHIFNPMLPGADGNRQGAAHRTDRAVERQFTHGEMFVEAFECAHRAEDRERHRQVKTGAFFTHVSWGEVQGNGLAGVAKTRIHHRRFDAFPTLANRRIRHADQQ